MQDAQYSKYRCRIIFVIFMIYIMASCFHLIIYCYEEVLAVILAYKNTNEIIYTTVIMFLKMLLYSLLYVPFIMFYTLQYVFAPANEGEFNFIMIWYFWLVICFALSYLIGHL